MAGMKAKTIKSILNKKISQWIESVEDESLREKLKKSVIVTGGSIVSMLLDEKVHDYDIYLRDKETVRAVAEYYVARFKSRTQKGIDVPLYVEENDDGRIRIVAKSAGIAGVEGTEQPYEYFEGKSDEVGQSYVSSIIDNPQVIEDAYEDTEEKVLNQDEPNKSEGPGYRPVFLTSNAITLSNRIQIVLRFYGEPDDIHEWYDYVHCTNYWTNWNNELVLRPEAMEAILTKDLKYVGSKYPVCSVVRLRKFIKRGWTINAGQIVKMAMQISDLDLHDVSVLEDQLTGVDTAYFIQIIERIKEKDPEKVNSAYLCEIIDRLF